MSSETSTNLDETKTDPKKIIHQFENADKKREAKEAKERQKMMFSKRMAKFQPQEAPTRDGISTCM